MDLFLLLSVAQSCLILCNPMDFSIADFPVLHCLLEFAQTVSIVLMMPSNHLILCLTFLLLPSIFPSIRVFFSVNWFFTSGVQSIEASAAVLPMNIQDWFPLGLTGLVSLQSKGLWPNRIRGLISLLSLYPITFHCSHIRRCVPWEGPINFILFSPKFWNNWKQHNKVSR